MNHQKNSAIYRLDYLDKFRNAIQHIDINLKKTNVKMLENRRPIYGALKWVVFEHLKNETYTSLLISGIYTGSKIKFTQYPHGKYSDFINEIVLETDTLKKKDDNEINISNLIIDISEIIKKVDDNLNATIIANNLKKLDWKHIKDVILNMKNDQKV